MDLIIVKGMVEVAGLDNKRHTDAHTARPTITPPKLHASGNLLTVAILIQGEMDIIVETAIQ